MHVDNATKALGKPLFNLSTQLMLTVVQLSRYNGNVNNPVLSAGMTRSPSRRTLASCTELGTGLRSSGTELDSIELSVPFG